MLRRVARVLRVALLGAGIFILVSFPISFFVHANVYTFDGAVNGWALTFSQGSVDWLYSGLGDGVTYQEGELRGSLSWHADLTGFTAQRLLPAYSKVLMGGLSTVIEVVVPLWLLAFMCLAWPVTSFIVARRRGKGRGFEVEARPGAAVPPPES